MVWCVGACVGYGVVINGLVCFMMLGACLYRYGLIWVVGVCVAR